MMKIQGHYNLTGDDIDHRLALLRCHRNYIYPGDVEVSALVLWLGHSG